MVVCIDSLRVIILGLVLLLVLPYSTQAHNGSLAIAVPVEEVVIDGDLSDWPVDVTWNPLQSRWGASPEDVQDLQAHFAVAYNVEENALYVAVEVRDDSPVLEAEDLQWYNVDGCQLYVDPEHTEEDVPIGTFRMWGLRPDTYRNARLEDFHVAVQCDVGVHRYEWRVDIGGHSQGQVHLQPGQVLGVGVGPWDVDADDSFTQMFWGVVKSGFDSAYMGDVILAPSAPGQVEGRLMRTDGRGVARRMLQVRSLDDPALWLVVQTDEDGAFALTLAPGRYRLTTGSLTEFDVEVDVRVGEKIQLGERLIPPPRGRRTKAGAGSREGRNERSIPAGNGQWQGAWQTLRVADGLSDPSVTAICQDREGNIWLATNGGGICRFNGETFTSYSAEGRGVVSSILQDREDNIWFGTGLAFIEGSGLVRYDGETFTAYTTADGLPSDKVLCLLESGSGSLWIGTERGLVQYDGETFATYTIPDGLADDGVTALAEDGEGFLWIGTEAGLVRYDGTYFESLSREEEMGCEITSIILGKEGGLWFSPWGKGVCRYDGGPITCFSAEEELASNVVFGLLEDRLGHLWVGTLRGLSQYDGQTWTTFTPAEGLAHQSVMSAFEDRNGDLWFGTGMVAQTWGISGGNGVSRFVGEEFATFTTEEGMAADQVMALAEDSRGNIWFGTWGGASWYDGQEMKTLEEFQESVFSIVGDSRGNMWIGSNGRGAFRYDGKTLEHFTSESGLPHRVINQILEDREGNLWFVGSPENEDGVSRYDGQVFVTLDTTNGLLDNRVVSIAQDREGNLWFGAQRGISRYDGQVFTHFTAEDGLASGRVGAILEDRQGHLWFGSLGGGVSRYDGERFVTFTTEDGLSHNNVQHIMEDRQGDLWFSTWGGGVSRYDGQVFQTLLRGDVLPHDATQETLQARNGDIWIATEGGAVRFRPRSSSPPVRITDVIADREYGPLVEVSLPATQDRLAFAFLGTSFKTRPNQMVYQYRLEGYDDGWRQTRQRQVAYHDLPIGDYLFQVQAVDRDLNYAEEPAQVRVTVHPPYAQLGLIGGLGIAIVALIAVSVYALKKRHDLYVEMEEELQTAHDMQMGLMPLEAPHISGFNIASCCLPANHVGGDFFQYFEQDGKLSISMADVTGHAMEAAVPVMMFSGILKSQMEIGGSVEEVFGRLNRSLYGTLDKRTFVCFTMGELDTETRNIHLANGGCPYPYHFQASTSTISELQLDAYPLAIRSDSEYQTIDIQLEQGDRIVFCSDGIIEAENAQEEIFGFERTAEMIRAGCAEGLSEEALIDHLIGAVQEFAGDTPQGDDMTIVVLKVEV